MEHGTCIFENRTNRIERKSRILSTSCYKEMYGDQCGNFVCGFDIGVPLVRLPLNNRSCNFNRKPLAKLKTELP